MAQQMTSTSLPDEHAERMDRMYRYQRHIYDATRKYYLFGRDRAVEGLNVPPGATLLEVGCGTGRNLLLAHRHYPTAKLYGLDISAAMLESARANFRGRAAEPNFQVADATNFKAEEFGATGFDRILISYALSMIPNWEGAVDAALAALAPNGSLHIVDFGQQEEMPDWFRAALFGWLARFHVAPRALLIEAAREVANDAGARLAVTRLYRDYAWSLRLDKRPR